TDPATAIVELGYSLDDFRYADFNKLFLSHDFGVGDTLDRVTRGELSAESDMAAELADAVCALCRIGTYTIAATIVGIGAAAIATLAVTSPVVIAFAGYFAVTAATALAAIVGLTAAIAAGVASVCTAICEWAGTCS
ncbi:MAG: hypothetical protein H8D69_00795, partial [Chloroflexi bacterium]|nr:hypothetical protein [Chloroflexota bacterium]